MVREPLADLDTNFLSTFKITFSKDRDSINAHSAPARKPTNPMPQQIKLFVITVELGSAIQPTPIAPTITKIAVKEKVRKPYSFSLT